MVAGLGSGWLVAQSSPRESVESFNRQVPSVIRNAVWSRRVSTSASEKFSSRSRRQDRNSKWRNSQTQAQQKSHGIDNSIMSGTWPWGGGFIFEAQQPGPHVSASGFWPKKTRTLGVSLVRFTGNRRVRGLLALDIFFSQGSGMRA